jgi:pimeloyl-ACP methyl ester carboxylesterase
VADSREELKTRLRPASVSPARGTVIFIHHYGGSRATSHWHQSLVNDMGFDAFAFDLSGNRIPQWSGRFPENLEFHSGVIERWADELNAVLDTISGPKILYSFSFPSVAVPAALFRRPRADVRAWICDGGPFLEMMSCQWNLFTSGYPVPNPLKRAALTAYSYTRMGGPLYTLRVHKWVRALSPDLPILSIRGAHDPLVPPRATDLFFACNPRLNLQRFLMPEGGHLDGLKRFAKEYTETVRSFLAAKGKPN